MTRSNGSRLALAGAMVLLALTTLTLTAGAQRKERVPQRPKLDASADTNDFRVYYELGLSKLKRAPLEAADAFYWGLRLNPGHGEGLYARRVALLLTDDRRLYDYWRGDRRTVGSAEVKAIDSLYFRALMNNPYMHLGLDRHLLDGVVRYVAKDVRNSSAQFELEHLMHEWMNRAGPATRGWLAYTEGRFADALKFYSDAIRSARRKAPLRVDRGRIFFQLGQVDSAEVEFAAALEEMRKTDAKDMVFIYESKALLEHTRALIHERRGDREAAKAAYGRALEEDLAYYPAHLQLGMLALEMRDTATALHEIDLAVQIAPAEANLRSILGYTLSQAGRHEEAIEHLRKATELEPFFAAPYVLLGEALEAVGRQPEAVEAYTRFVERAARSDSRRPAIARKLRELNAATGTE